MSNGAQLEKITKTIKDHEQRIKYLENLVEGKSQSDITKRKSIFDHLNYLKSVGFFDQPKPTKEIIQKLAEEGYHYPDSSLTEPLQRAVRQGVLGRIKRNKIWAYCKR